MPSQFCCKPKAALKKKKSLKEYIRVGVLCGEGKESEESGTTGEKSGYGVINTPDCTKAEEERQSRLHQEAAPNSSRGVRSLVKSEGMSTPGGEDTGTGAKAQRGAKLVSWRNSKCFRGMDPQGALVRKAGAAGCSLNW